MSLDPVTSGLGRDLPVNNKATETATNTVQSTAQKPVKQVQETTKPLTDPVIPGEFPSEDGPRDTEQPPRDQLPRHLGRIHQLVRIDDTASL